MYLQHFGLREMPFSLTPNTHFFLNVGSHHEAMNLLLVGLENAAGFIKVVGEVGTGKTLLCRQLLNCLGDNYVTAYIPNPHLTPAGMRVALAEELGLTVHRNAGQHKILALLSERLVELARDDKLVVVIIDEAQAMPEDTVEALRLLTNLETETQKLLQVVLFGQPELDTLLDRPSLRQLKQRITFSYTLSPLDEAGLDRYVSHRLSEAGYNGEQIFTKKALKTLFKASRGIPRLVNILCHKSLMVAYGQGRQRVELEAVQRACDDTDGTRSNDQKSRRYWLIASVAAALILLIAVPLTGRLV